MTETLRALYERGLKQAQAGAFAEAEASLRAAAALAPRDPAVAFYLGRVLRERGALAAAIEHFRRAAGPKGPVRAAALADLGVTAMMTGAVEEARKALNASVRLAPDNWQAHHNLVLLAAESGDVRAAARHAARCLALAPEDAASHNAHGIAHRLAGDMAAAEAAFAEALARAPGAVDITRNWARAAQAVGKRPAAVAALADLLDKEPAPAAETRRLLAGALDDEGEAGRALEVLAPLVDDETPEARDLVQAAGIAERAGLIDRAGALARAALDGGAVRGAEADGARLVAARLARRAGDLASARVALEATTVAPSDDPHLAAEILFERGRIADRMGEARAAFDACRDGNRVMAELERRTGSDPARHLAKLAAMGDWLESAGALPTLPDGEGSDGPRLILLTGFARTGTTLLVRALESHPDILALDEPDLGLDDMPAAAVEPDGPALATADPATLAALRARVLDRIAGLASEAGDLRDPGGRCVVVKIPMGVLAVPPLLAAFPTARLIAMHRHPCDAVLSAFFQNFSNSDMLHGFRTLEGAATMFDGTLRCLAACEALLPEDRRMTIRYETLVADFEAGMRDLAEFLGVAYDPSLVSLEARAAARSRRVRTPSYHQITDVVTDRAVDRWRAHEEALAPVLPVLKPWCARLGYDAE